jgi:SAM-dependent methyltransferase
MLHTPYIGDPRSASLKKTIQVFINKITRISPLKGGTFLDVGCGDGSFTIPLSGNYSKVIGLDVQQAFLDTFKEKVNGNDRFEILNMSAEKMSFASNSIDTIVTIETIEHIPDLQKAAKEFYRVLKPGAELVITCPNRLFPFENHGMRLGKKQILTRIPLLPYFPFLHNRLGLARVFTVRSLDKLFLPLGFKKEKVDYIWPTFEHGGNVFSPLLRPFFKVMRRMEESPLRLFGTSILIRYVKPQ